MSSKFHESSPVFAEGVVEVGRQSNHSQTKHRWHATVEGQNLYFTREQLEDMVEAFNDALDWQEEKDAQKERRNRLRVV